MIRITFAEEPKTRGPVTLTHILIFWAAFIGLIFAAGKLAGQTSYIPASSPGVRISWNRSTRGAGDIVHYSVKIADSVGGFWYDWDIADTTKPYVDGQIPRKGTAYVQAFSTLTEKTSPWSAGASYVWLKSGQIPQPDPEPEPPDTTTPDPTGWVAAVYDGQNMANIWRFEKWNCASFYQTAVKSLMIPSELLLTASDGVTQINPYAEISLNLPTTGDYYLRLEGTDNGVKTFVDGVEFFTAAFQENKPTAWQDKIFLQKGIHRFRVYGWSPAAQKFKNCLIKEARIFRPEDYPAPGPMLIPVVSEQ